MNPIAPKSNRPMDHAPIWLTRLVVFLMPLMLLNPVDPKFHRLQVTELFAIPLIALTVILIATGRVRTPTPPVWAWMLSAFIASLYLGALTVADSPVNSMIEAMKITYLFLLGASIWLNGHHYGIAESLIRWTVAGWATVIGGAIIGALLLLAGIETFLAHPSRIIGIALGISDWLPVVPRINSFLQPTANMLGAYLAVASLVAITYVGQHTWWQNRRWLLLALVSLVTLITALTMSRTLAGLLLALWLGLGSLRWQLPLAPLLRPLALAGTLIVFVALQMVTIFYPLGGGLEYSNDPTHEKEIVDMGPGKDDRPNPVYFVRPDVGLERVTISIDYSINHYAWLKYAAWKTFEDSPLLGVGIGNYSSAVAKLSAVSDIPAGVAAYTSAQSQYATLLAETGLIGCILFFGAIALLLRRLFRASESTTHPWAFACLLSLVVAAFISIDIDMLAFRWIWGLVAVALVPLAPDVVQVPSSRNPSHKATGS